MKKFLILSILLIFSPIIPSSFQEEQTSMQSLQELVLELINQKKYDKALVTLEQILDLEPNNSFALNNKGAILLEQEKYSEAILVLDKALEINPENTESWNNKAVAYVKIVEYAKALESFYQSLKIDPTNQIAFDNAKWLTGQLPFIDYSPVSYAIIQTWDENGNLLVSSKAAHIGILPGIGIEVLKNLSTIETVIINDEEVEIIKFHHKKFQDSNEYVGGTDLFYYKGDDKFKIVEIKTHGFIVKEGDYSTVDLVLIDSAYYLHNK